MNASLLCRVHSNLLADAEHLRLNAAVFRVAPLDRYMAEHCVGVVCNIRFWLLQYQRSMG
jgi:hypothetical protein